MSALGAIVLALVLAAGSDEPKAAPDAASTVVAQTATDRFEFHSAFWVNLHHFLHCRARVAKGLDRGRDSVEGAAQDAGAIDTLDPEERAGFDEALEWYSDNLAKKDILFDEGLRETTQALVLRESADSPRGPGVGDDVAAALEHAAPAYKKAWWSAHDAGNRAWLKAAEPLLEKEAAGIAAKLAKVYGVEWPVHLRVDLVPWANWAGAYTVNGPNRVTLGTRSPGNAELYAIESLFHEASHVMEGPLGDALAASSKKHDVTPPKDLWHVVIFFTAGELVRELHPEHVPYAQKFGLYQRVPGWQAQRALCEEFWSDVIDGKATREDAIDKMVADLKGE